MQRKAVVDIGVNFWLALVVYKLQIEGTSFPFSQDRLETPRHYIMHVHYGFWLHAVFAVCLHQCHAHAHTCRDGERYSAWLPTRACTHHIKDVIKLVCASFPSFMGEESGETKLCRKVEVKFGEEVVPEIYCKDSVFWTNFQISQNNIRSCV